MRSGCRGLGALALWLVVGSPIHAEDIDREIPPPLPAFELLSQPIAPGERRELALPIGDGMAGAVVHTPVVAVRGARPGPTACVTGGIHGDEVNGIEIVRRLLLQTDPSLLSGVLVGVPIANLHGFQRSSRYLPDRRDLNRHFPGLANGSSASRIAHRLFDGVIRHCDVLVDFHTGSFHRHNLPQVRGDLSREDVYDLAVGFGAPVVVHTYGTRGTLRRAATEAGIAAITYEAGEPVEFDEEGVEGGVAGTRRLLAHLGMLPGGRTEGRSTDAYYRSRWVRANAGGIFLADAALGKRVAIGQTMGYITDPISNESVPIISPYAGRVIGIAVDQVVMPGFAAFHVGIEGDRPETFPAEPDTPTALDEPVELDERPE